MEEARRNCEMLQEVEGIRKNWKWRNRPGTVGRNGKWKDFERSRRSWDEAKGAASSWMQLERFWKHIPGVGGFRSVRKGLEEMSGIGSSSKGSHKIWKGIRDLEGVVGVIRGLKKFDWNGLGGGRKTRRDVEQLGRNQRRETL